jgi:hypothetical protein
MIILNFTILTVICHKIVYKSINKEYWKIINYTPDSVKNFTPYEHHNVNVYENAHSVLVKGICNNV